VNSVTRPVVSSPVAAWVLPEPISTRLPNNYIIALPQPDRTPYPLIQISFRSSPGDFTTAATYSDIAAWLDSVVEGAILSLANNIPLTPAVTPTYNRTTFSYPDSGIVGPYSATYQLRDNYDDSFMRQQITDIISLVKSELTNPHSNDILNSAQNLDLGILVIHFTSIKVTSRLPGDIPVLATSLWVDGVEVPPIEPIYEPGPQIQAFFSDFLASSDIELALLLVFPFATSKSSISDSLWLLDVDVDAADHNSVSFQACVNNGLNEEQTQILVTEIFRSWTPDTSSYAYFMKSDYFSVVVRSDTAPDANGLGGIISCSLSIHIYSIGVATAASTKLQYNTDKTPNRPGPFVYLGGVPTKFEPTIGHTRFLGELSDATLEDLSIYSVAAADVTIYKPDESFLRTEVNCGDGEIDNPEECDARDPSCTSDCTCPLRTVPLAPFGCTVCGNGIRDWEAFNVRKDEFTEVCEYTLDPNCKTDCSGCTSAAMIQDVKSGLCTFCGNGKLDLEAGESCDWKFDVKCKKDCKSCSGGYYPTGLGGCFLCGNGLLDEGEACDGNELCSSDCTSCAPGYVSDLRGGCTKCGNGVVDDGEICDTLLTACTDCRSCDENHVPAIDGLGCTRCGNGALDAGEVCDTAYPSCTDDCSACLPGTVPSADKLGSCSLCGNGVLNKGERCDGDANCVACLDCREPYALVSGGRCLLCGNGLLDDGEVCDSAHVDSCASACQACAPGFEANLDPVANPTGRCFPTSCDSAPTTDNSECECK